MSECIEINDMREQVYDQWFLGPLYESYSDIRQLVDAGTKPGSSYLFVPKFVLGLEDIKAAGMHYLTNTVWEYEIVRKNLENCFFLGDCSYGKLKISFYVHESCSRIFTIIKGIKGSSYSVTNIGTAGYLGTQESMPDIFILQDEVVFLPITGIDGNPYTLCSFSESLENESKTRVSFDPPRFLKKNKNSTLDIINVQDKEFNEAILEACGALKFTAQAGPVFTSITKLELISSQKELLTSAKFVGADMET